MSAIIKKIWIVNGTPSVEDVIWVKGLGCEFSIEEADPAEDFVVNGLTYRYAGMLGKLRILSTCKKQESMLKLKYGDDLHLIQVIHRIASTNTPVPNGNYSTDI